MMNNIMDQPGTQGLKCSNLQNGFHKYMMNNIMDQPGTQGLKCSNLQNGSLFHDFVLLRMF